MARKSAAKTNVNWLDAFPTHRLMTLGAALGGEVLLALVAFDSLLNNFYLIPLQTMTLMLSWYSLQQHIAEEESVAWIAFSCWPA